MKSQKKTDTNTEKDMPAQIKTLEYKKNKHILEELKKLKEWDKLLEE